MTKTRIDILLPFKEKLSSGNEGAIASIVRDLVQIENKEQEFMIFGRPLNTPPSDLPYTSLSPRFNGLFGGQNLGFAAAYLHHLKSHQKPDAIEIHGRCQVAAKIAKSSPEIPIFLYLHNDPTEMKGAKTIRERQNLLNRLAGVFCVSDYIKQKFCEGLNPPPNLEKKLVTIRNGVTRWLDAPKPKTTSIVIAGRLVPEKGILHACRAIAPVLAQHQDWHLHIIGGRHFAHEPPTPYEQEIIGLAEKMGKQATMHGFMDKQNLRKFQEQAEIIIVPSLWPEPAGLTNLEALAAGAALISTATGGAGEYIAGKAVIIQVDNNQHYAEYAYPEFSKNLAEACELLMRDEKKRRALQEHAWQDYPFGAETMSNTAVKMRKNLMNSFTSKAV